MKSALKPCPFCGSADVNLRRVRSGRIRVSCPCGADGPIYEKERAIAEWNARAGVAEDDERPDWQPPQGPGESDADYGTRVWREWAERSGLNRPGLVEEIEADQSAARGEPRAVDAKACESWCGFLDWETGLPNLCNPECRAAGKPVRPSRSGQTRT